MDPSSQHHQQQQSRSTTSINQFVVIEGISTVSLPSTTTHHPLSTADIDYSFVLEEQHRQGLRSRASSAASSVASLPALLSTTGGGGGGGGGVGSGSTSNFDTIIDDSEGSITAKSLLSKGRSNNNMVSSSSSSSGTSSAAAAATAAAASNFKLILLILMVLQNSSTVLVGRYTRTTSSSSTSTTSTSTSTDSIASTTDELYDVGHLIMITELSKLVLSILFEFISVGTSYNVAFQSIKVHCFDRYNDAIKISIPAILYLIQNTLLYVALENLTAPIFQVTYQAKLVTTAIVSVFLLNRSYNIRQWICLVLLSIGVAIVVLGEQQQNKKVSTTTTSTETKQNLVIGLTAVSIACFSSALAGVYFEMVLKKEKPIVPTNATTNTTSTSTSTTSPTSSTVLPTTINKNFDTEKTQQQQQLQQQLSVSEPSLWIRNVQLSFFTILTILVQQLFTKASKTSATATAATTEAAVSTVSKSYLHGFTTWVWILVLLQAGGGLLVAAVIKYADNVLKGLATGVSVVFATCVSIILFNTTISNQFIYGAILILTSVYYFSNPIPVPISTFLRSIVFYINKKISSTNTGLSKQEKRTLLPK